MQIGVSVNRSLISPCAYCESLGDSDEEMTDESIQREGEAVKKCTQNGLRASLASFGFCTDAAATAPAICGIAASLGCLSV